MITKEEFKSLTPKKRGYLVYIYGCKKEEPNIPNEENPYLKESKESKQWNEGNYQAMLDVQDGEE